MLCACSAFSLAAFICRQHRSGASTSSLPLCAHASSASSRARTWIVNKPLLDPLERHSRCLLLLQLGSVGLVLNQLFQFFLCHFVSNDNLNKEDRMYFCLLLFLFMFLGILIYKKASALCETTKMNKNYDIFLYYIYSEVDLLKWK